MIDITGPRASKLSFRHWFVIIGSSAAVVAACSSGSSKQDQVDPPTLVLTQIQNAMGATFEPSEDVDVACDRRLTLQFGPSSETPNLLDNWELRPPGNCGDRDQCGFIRLHLKYDDGTSVQVNRASLSLVLEENLVSKDLELVEAQLIDGRNGAIFTVDDLAVQTQWEPQLVFADCPDPNPGLGGMGGSDGTDFPAGGQGGEDGSDMGGASFGGQSATF